MTGQKEYIITEPKDPAAVTIHCPVCGWQKEVEKDMWDFQSSPGGHGYTCGSGKCSSHTYMVLGPAPNTAVDLKEENKPGCFGAIGLPGKRNDPGCPCAWQERCRQSQEDC